ncbi:helicase [Seminavis robusta]|uniref:Helicase n=1 Tax=Seminavis robusta TaxID=568900 RepID=A0A9N8ECL6_9STRA|nr:helicase [Seminavis robusta]|eukprot:Sro808_g205350.1 helicase (322) ;mRNA; r:6084-7145
MTFTADNDGWNAKLEKLKAFKESHGHCAVPITGSTCGLGKWWHSSFVLLRQFKEQNGHCRVPRTSERQLGMWVRQQRETHRQGKMIKERFRRLEELGFVWNPPNGKRITQQALEEEDDEEEEDEEEESDEEEKEQERSQIETRSMKRPATKDTTAAWLEEQEDDEEEESDEETKKPAARLNPAFAKKPKTVPLKEEEEEEEDNNEETKKPAAREKSSIEVFEICSDKEEEADEPVAPSSLAASSSLAVAGMAAAGMPDNNLAGIQQRLERIEFALGFPPDKYSGELLYRRINLLEQECGLLPQGQVSFFQQLDALETIIGL